jgi:hypothetical protein
MDMAQLEAYDTMPSSSCSVTCPARAPRDPGFNVFAYRHSGDGSSLAQAQAGADLARPRSLNGTMSRQGRWAGAEKETYPQS